MKNFFKKVWAFFTTNWTHIKSAARLVKSVLFVGWRQKAPHDWVQTSTLDRKHSRVYARCSRCGATR